MRSGCSTFVIRHSTFVHPSSLPLELSPAGFEVAENLPEELAVHAPGDAAAGAGVERVGLGVFDVMGDLVEERVEELLERSPAELAVVGIDTHELPRLVIAPQDARRGTRVDVDLVIDQAAIRPVEAGPE